MVRKSWRVVPMLAVVALALASPSSAGAAEQEAVAGRVATFNVCNPSPCAQDGRAELIAAQIANAQPEVIALQEICVSQTDAVRDILESEYGLTYHVQHGSVLENFWRCGGTPWDPGNFGNALLSASPFVESGNAEYGDGGSEDRGYAWGDTVVNGSQVRVYATHLAQGDQAAARAGQVDELVAHSTTFDNVIVLGDFNATPSAAELAPMWTSYADADPNCAPPENENCQLTHPGAAKKFDYIWLDRDWFGDPPGVSMVDNFSDHNLVYADLG